MPICRMALRKDNLSLDMVLWADAGDCVQLVSKAFDSQLLQSPMHSARTPDAFEDLQSSGFWAGDGQSAPYCLLLRPESPCRRGPLDFGNRDHFELNARF